MTNKVVDITIKQLDITQVFKMRQYFTNDRCDRGSVNGAYNYELRELLDAIIKGGYENKSVIVAPDLTIC